MVTEFLGRRFRRGNMQFGDAGGAHDSQSRLPHRAARKRPQLNCVSHLVNTRYNLAFAAAVVVSSNRYSPGKISVKLPRLLQFMKSGEACIS